MNTKICCPPDTELRELLNGTLSSDRQESCTQHMDSCECCQTRLEELATGGSQLVRVVEGLHQSQPEATSAYWPAYQALDSGSQPTVVPQTVGRSREVTLKFLEPATDPAYLGRLAHFDVMRVLGRGGMGLVLEAFDSRLQRHVALKILDPEQAGDEISRQRFCREARAAASVTHENVVAVHQVERSVPEGLPYLVMQLISGESLEQRLQREKQLPLREVVRIGMQAAQGLAAAHAQGLIHRDIKPGNILLEAPHDRVKLTDFGLARAAEDVKLTRTGFVSGTPLYMAPEQALGEETDHRSDLFSLGAILYEMCAGQPPFAGNSALALLKQIAETKHRPLRELNPNVPEWLATTVDRLLEKKPADRIQTAAQLAELFEFEWALMKATSEEVPMVCQIEQHRRRVRHRWIAAAVGATFLTLGLVGGWFLFNRPGTVSLQSTAPPVAELSANAGTVWAVAFHPSQDKLAMAVEDGTVRLWDVKKKSVQSTVDAHRGTIWATIFSQDGSRFVTAGDDGLIKLWDPASPEPLQTFKHSNAVRGLAWSKDNQRLYAGDRDGLLRIWSVDNPEQPLETQQQPGAIYSVSLSPDGETLATAGSDRVIRLWGADKLTAKLPLEGHRGPIYGLSFNSDGTRLASGGWDRTIRIWDTGSGELVQSWSAADDGDIWNVAYLPNGKQLATVGTDGALKIWDIGTGQLQATYLGHKIAVHSLAVELGGKRLASGGRDGIVRVWEMNP